MSRLLLIGWLLEVILVSDAFSQSIRFHRFTINDGLSQSTIRSIAQDEAGFIWMATQDGLNRFDGKNFRTWKRNRSSTSLADNDLNQILGVGEFLWIATQGAGINVYSSSSDSMATIALPGKNHVHALLKASTGEIWAATENSVYILDAASGKVRQVIDNFTATIFVATALAEDNNHNIWMATRHDGVFVFNAVTKEVISHIWKARLGLSTHLLDPVWHVMFHPEHGIFLSSNKGLFLLKDVSDTVKIKPMVLEAGGRYFTKDAIMCTLIDHQGKLWIGTQNGILKGDQRNNSYQHLRHDSNNPHSLSDRYVLTLFQDRNNNIWIGTYNGVNTMVYSEPMFKSYSMDLTDPSKSLKVVRSIYTENDTNIFVGTVNSLWLFDKNSERLEAITDERGQHLQNVFSLIPDHDGNLWCGHSKGFQMITRSANGYHVNPSETHPELRTFIHSEVTQCVWIRESLYLMATLNENGLYVWDASHRTIRNLSEANSDLPHNKINHIYKSAGGKIWIATDRGFCSYDVQEDQFTNYFPTRETTVDPGFQVVNSILEDDGILWLATNGGLLQFYRATKTFQFYSEDDGLANHNLYCCMKAEDGALWMSSNVGLSKFNSATKRFTNYDVSDGLQSNEYNRYAWFRSPSGQLYFGGMEGFDEIVAVQNLNTAPLVVTNIRTIQENKFADLQPDRKQLRLRHTQNAIGFEYAALDFGHPHRYEYLCKLEGFDNAWIDNGPSTSISYTNLPPGDYTFRVRLKDTRTVSEGSYSFSIIAAFWQTRYFIALLVLAFLMIVTLMLRSYYKRKLEKQRVAFERQKAVELERTRIATDIHDDLGAGLSRIKFLSESITLKTEHREPISDDVVKIKAYSNEMIDKMGEIVWALNEKNDSLGDLVSYIRAYAAEYLAQNNIECTVTLPMELASVPVSGEFRRNIFLAVKEALHNIVKHAKSSVTRLDIRVDKALVITIQDNGRGFDLHGVRPYSNGIGNMKKRMNDIGGHMIIRTEGGTFIELTAPL